MGGGGLPLQVPIVPACFLSFAFCQHATSLASYSSALFHEKDRSGGTPSFPEESNLKSRTAKLPMVTKQTIKPARAISGTVEVPGDKSISHRYALLAALAQGRSEIFHFSEAADCQNTLECLARLG